jgi:exopolysaccharide biosynthesis polyprenyl glycosylphosphotransferase
MTPLLRRDLVLSAQSPYVPFGPFGPASLADHLDFEQAVEVSAELGALADTESGHAITSSVRYSMKLVLDRVLASVALVILAPLMVAIAIAIKLESPGPALFAQPRVGFCQRIFKCYKFRSMYHHLQDEGGTRQAIRGDVRVTPIGRLLRRTSLDELPQLLNVLKGDMSCVGPRPHARDTRAGGRTFSEIVPFYDRRHCVLPGITGWAQVNGWRGETRTAEDIEMRVRYDLEYIARWSLFFDIRIMVLTLIRLFNDDAAV